MCTSSIFSTQASNLGQATTEFNFLFQKLSEEFPPQDGSMVRSWHCDNFVLLSNFLYLRWQQFQKDRNQPMGLMRDKSHRSGTDSVESSPLASLSKEEKNNHGLKGWTDKWPEYLNGIIAALFIVQMHHILVPSLCRVLSCYYGQANETIDKRSMQRAHKTDRWSFLKPAVSKDFLIPIAWKTQGPYVLNEL